MLLTKIQSIFLALTVTLLLCGLSLIYFYLFFESNYSDSGESITLNITQQVSVQHVICESVVLITVLYECLCPDSRQFFNDQLLPTVENMPKNVSVELVPYGKTKTEEISNGTYNFECQHGPKECLGNKVHACLLNVIEDTLTKVQVITCMINNNYNAEEIGRNCSKKYNIIWEHVETCLVSGEGDILLKKYGEITEEVLPNKTFLVPTVLLNSEMRDQNKVLHNLKDEVYIILTN